MEPIDPPTAMINEEGILLTDPNEIAKEAIKHYQKLFANMPINDDIKETQIWREKLCMMRLTLCAENKTDPWTI